MECSDFPIDFICVQHRTKQVGVNEKSILRRVAAIPAMTRPCTTHFLGMVVILLSQQAPENTAISPTNNMPKLNSMGMLHLWAGLAVIALEAQAASRQWQTEHCIEWKSSEDNIQTQP